MLMTTYLTIDQFFLSLGINDWFDSLLERVVDDVYSRKHWLNEVPRFMTKRVMHMCYILICQARLCV